MSNAIVRWGIVVIAIAACGMYVWTGATSDSPMPWVNGWMAAPLIALSFVPFVFRMTSGPSKRELRSGGVLAIGTLVDARRTGMSINDQPQLDLLFDVETVEGKRFRGVARQIVDLTQLAMLRPGTTLPVRYLPEKMDGKVAIANDADPVEVQRLLQRLQVAKGAMTEQQVRVANEGIEARAVIIEMRPTGDLRGGNAVVEMLLRVTRPDGSSYDARVEKALPPAAIPGVQPGSVVRAKYLPENEQEVGLEVQYA